MKKRINTNSRAKRMATVGLVTALSASLVACGSVDYAIKRTASGETRDVQAGEEIEVAFKSAAFVENTGFKIVLNTAFLGDAKEVFVIKDGEGNVVPILDAKVVLNTNVTFTVDNKKIDIMGKYTITYGEVTVDVRMPCQYSKKTFEEAYTYTGNDLGTTYSKEKTAFRVWAPTATEVKVNLYKSGTAGTDDFIETITMTADVNGTWIAEKAGDLNGVYYTYSVTVSGVVTEACDPYARTTGVNGDRAMIIDLDSTNPEGWENDKNPNPSGNITEAVIYEMHIRDMTVDSSSGITNKGKYIGLTETGTKTSSGFSTGLDYIKDLGVNYVHILPMYDFGSVDETKLDTEQYNWGYDPVNYNVPEGSYSTDPYNGEVRVKELKQMVKSFHDNGISVIMDVVYNHVYDPQKFCFNQIVPEYFSRVSETGVFSDGSQCGNDVATERAMVRKYIVDSVLYWAEEYHVDGFRFDLAGIIDIDTMNAIIETVHAVRPDVIFYGEGWEMKTTPTKGVQLVTTGNSLKVPGFSYFSEYFRDNIRGKNDNSDAGKGFINGKPEIMSSNIKSMLMGMSSWSIQPYKTVNYAVCHDNNTLHDKIALAMPSTTIEDRIARTKLSAGIVLMSQGVPFIMSGEELLRSKVNEDGSYNYNSYNAGDKINSIKYDDIEKDGYRELYDYYKGLIEFRRAHKALCMMTYDEVSQNITMSTDTKDGVVAYHINGGANGDSSNGIFIIVNGLDSEQTINLPAGNWSIHINDEKAGTTSLGTASGTVTVKGVSIMVLVLE